MTENFENVTNAKIGLVSVQDLAQPEVEFFIPSYQRGYRWTEFEVQALLSDILEFDEEKDGKFYCLQPLVVKKEKYAKEGIIKERWRVVDGQQRLTTIYLILKYLQIKDPFSIEYERSTKISECSSFEKDDDTIEEYYLKFNFHKSISKWTGWNVDTKRSIAEKLNVSTKFIWYDIDIVDNADEYTIFRNLNSGKISLTNAELVKALFLKNTAGSTTEKDISQNLMAEEYDQIERRLREPEFWYFLNGRTEQPSSCIDFLFDLMYKTDKDLYNEKGEPNKLKHCFEKVGSNKIFYYFERKTSYDNVGKRYGIKEQFENVSAKWKEALNYFHILEGWYSNPAVFNLIGFLRSIGYDIEKIFKLYKDSENKENFELKLKNTCYEECGLDIAKDQSDYMYIKELFKDFRYDNNKDIVTRVLLLTNIASLNLQETQNNAITDKDKKDKRNEISKFSFASYHTCAWNIEHISPENAQYKPDKSKNIDFLNEIIPAGVHFNLGEKFIDSTQLSDSQKIEFDKYIAILNDSIMSLSNLTLLSENINKGIGNDFFHDKRKSVLRKQAEGAFVPPSTFMVFTKSYTEEQQDDNPYFWTETDRKWYLTKIYEILTKYNSNGKTNC